MVARSSQPNPDHENHEDFPVESRPGPVSRLQSDGETVKNSRMTETPPPPPVVEPPRTRELFRVIDNFCPQVDLVRASFLESGFGTWAPNRGAIGSSNYEGMNYVGRHELMLAALVQVTGKVILPNSVFARVTNLDTEKAYIHSDRHNAAHTVIAYLSEHEEVSGTAFWRHRRTGLTTMPTIEEMKAQGVFEELSRDMVQGGDAWEQIDFVRGLKNRALLFDAPLFHSRFPFGGIGGGAEDGRMIWCAHYYVMTADGRLA